MKKGYSVQKLACAAACLALALVLPFVTGQIPEVGNMLCPMHIPVILCGFICGPWYGAAVGLMAPPVRFMLFGMPPILPTGISMSVELGVYALVCGVLSGMLPKVWWGRYTALVVSMVMGRAAWGVMRVILAGLSSSAFSWAAFLAGAFTNALPGIVLQLVLIPAVISALSRALPWMKKR